MVIPGDILTDTVVLSLGSFIGYLVKILFKPSEAEAKLITKILVGVLMAVITFARRYSRDHREHLDSFSSELQVLKTKLKKDKIVLG